MRLKTRHINFNSLFKKLVMFLFFCLAAETGKSQTASAVLDTHFILIGDWLYLNLHVEHSPDERITWPFLVDTLNKFEIIETSAIDSQHLGSVIRQSRQLKLTIFDTGYFVIEPTWFAVENRKTGQMDSVKTEALLVTVTGVPVDTVNIKPIKAPIDTPLTLQEVLPYIYWGLGVLVLLGFLIWYFFLRKKPKPVVVKRPKPKQPPHEIALRKLAELEEKKWWQQGKVKTFYSELSDIVREYYEFRFDFPALESTTPEILHDLTRTSVRNELQMEMQQLLQLADMVKFAKVKPLPDEHEQSLKQAYNFVNGTKPRPVAEARELETSNSAA